MESLILNWHLFLAFFKTGLFSWGGGTAMIALMQKECVEHYQWLTDEQFAELVATNNVVPGVFAIKFAAFVGWQQFGILGAIVSCIGISAPGILLFVPLFIYLQKPEIKNNPAFNRFMDGIQFGAAGMILFSVLKVIPSMTGRQLHFAIGIVITLAVVAALQFKIVHPAIAIIVAGFIGLLIF